MLYPHTREFERNQCAPRRRQVGAWETMCARSEEQGRAGGRDLFEQEVVEASEANLQVCPAAPSRRPFTYIVASVGVALVPCGGCT